MTQLNTPCESCPFLLTQTRMLRIGRKREIAASLRRGEWFPCHKTVDYDNSSEGRTTHLNYKMVAVEANGRTDDRRRAVGKGERVAYTTERPAWYAKNRYGLPDKIEIPEGRPEVIWSEIDKAMTTPAMATEIATVS